LLSGKMGRKKNNKEGWGRCGYAVDSQVFANTLGLVSRLWGPTAEPPRVGGHGRALGAAVLVPAWLAAARALGAGREERER